MTTRLSRHLAALTATPALTTPALSILSSPSGASSAFTDPGGARAQEFSTGATTTPSPLVYKGGKVLKASKTYATY
jgi:hypothetical protein